MISVRFVRLHENARIPEYATPGAAGADLRSSRSYGINPGERHLVKTGVSIAIPDGYEGQIRPRSGLAHKHGITVLNAPGTIDSDYRGEIGVILHNTGTQTFWIEPGDRIAQIVFQKVENAIFIESGAFAETERGGGGFGSTGIK